MSRPPLRRGNWSVQEMERLRLLLPHRGVEQTATLLRRSPQSVQRKALELLRAAPRRGDWSEQEDRLLRTAWGAVELRLLGPMLGRPLADLRRRAGELRARLRTGPWAHAELRQLKRMYGTRHDEDLEVCLRRAGDDIREAARRLCLAKDKRFRASAVTKSRGAAAAAVRAPMPRWTTEEVQRLRELYPHHDNLRVAQELGRSVTSVANKAHQLGVRKSAELLTDIGRANIEVRYRGAPPRDATMLGAVQASPGTADASGAGRGDGPDRVESAAAE
ncbi:MAG: hypothetical protein H6835_02215 [Planctomycetes bacterium]|nr:hypothetical protein [Planctomycetota bacterium]